MANCKQNTKSPLNEVYLREHFQLSEKANYCKLQCDAELESPKAKYHWDAYKFWYVADTAKSYTQT